MIYPLENKRLKFIACKAISLCLGLILALSPVCPLLTPSAFAESVLNLPAPGTLVPLSEAYEPVIVMGLTVYPDDPLKFDFVIDQGTSELNQDAFAAESSKLIKYFLASLTIPEDEMWVNLSPYEKDRIIPDAFGQTEMGRDLLALDYMLKQLSSSLMHPDQQLGGEFWQRVYAKALKQFGSTDIPMNTFNKIWIVPERATVYEHASGAFIVESYLKVMLEEDYLALDANRDSTKHGLGDIDADELDIISGVSGEIVREVLIPEIEKEINQGRTFANLRQIYHSMLLAAWYKNKLKESVLGQIYVNQKRTEGVESADPTINQAIYEQYVEAFQEGVFSLIKEEVDPVSQEIIPRKYFSGGVELNGDQAMISSADLQNQDSIRQRVLDASNRLRNGVRVTFGLNASNPVGENADRLTFRSTDAADNAMMADISSFASEYQIEPSLVQALMVNSMELESFVEGALNAVRLRNPATRMTADDIQSQLAEQGVVADGRLTMDVIRASVEFREPAEAVEDVGGYIINGVEFSGIIVGAMQTEQFSNQLSRLSGQVDDSLIRELNQKGYLTDSIKKLSRDYLDLSDDDRRRVNEMMFNDGLTRSESISLILNEKEIDERQRVAIRSMDHSASASVDPFAKMSTLAGVFVLPTYMQGFSEAQLAEFKDLSETVVEFKNEMMSFAGEAPRRDDFDYDQIFDFQNRWQTISQRVAALVGAVRQAGQIAENDPESSRILLQEMTSLPQLVSREIEGQLAFARGDASYNRETVNLGNVVENAIEGLNAKRGFMAGYVSLDVDAEAENLVLDVNPVWIGLIISNLVNNAHDEIVKQIEDGQRPGFQPGDIQVRLSADTQSGEMTLTVHDTAGGIPQSTGLLEERFGRMRIFEYGRTQGKEFGTGVGLAEVYHITRLMNWGLNLNAQRRIPGGTQSGAEFQIVMPVQSTSSDKAMTADPVGGIDMNSAMVEMNISGEGEGFAFTPEAWNASGVEVGGFVPVIINIAPIQNLPFILGLTDTPQDESPQDPANGRLAGLRI